MATILVPLPEGFEEIETVVPVDLWRRAGHEVILAAVGTELAVTGRSGITVVADQRLADIDPKATFSLLFLPGGPGVRLLRTAPHVQARLAQQSTAGGWIAAICAAPLVLHDAGLLAGRHYTAHPSATTELTSIDETARIVVDGLIVTSRGAGTALDFALKIVELLDNEATAQRIAKDICA